MSEKNYVVNVKNKLGTIVTFRGDTAAELNTTIDQFIEYGLEFKVANVEAILLGMASAPAPAPSAVDLVQQTFGPMETTVTPLPPQPAFAPVPPPTGGGYAPAASAGTSSKACLHGEMTKREGSGQWGPYKAYYCPTPKGTPDQCKPVYVKPNDPEWNTF